MAVHYGPISKRRQVREWVPPLPTVGTYAEAVSDKRGIPAGCTGRDVHLHAPGRRQVREWVPSSLLSLKVVGGP